MEEEIILFNIYDIKGYRHTDSDTGDSGSGVLCVEETESGDGDDNREGN